jgi:hypothetical protein
VTPSVARYGGGMDTPPNPYRPLLGRWEAEGTAHLPDGGDRRHYWQIQFNSVLEDRAIQDVWITPPRTGPNVGKSENWGPFSNQYGTTIRVYDRKVGGWRCVWIDPCADYRAELVGRVVGGEIFQEGTGSDGNRVRWIFSDIGPDSFRWRAEVSKDGSAWHRLLDLFARRVADGEGSP